jgi:tetratricopeptide (TPR) repeat protein
MAEPAGSFQIDSAHSGEILGLERLLRGNPGFVLAFLQCGDSTYRRKVESHLAQMGFPGRTVTVDPDATDLEPLIEELSGLPDDGPIFVDSLDTWINGGDGEERAHRLNFARESLTTAADRPLLIWLDFEATRRVARNAPDVWAWRSAVLDLMKSVQADRGPAVVEHEIAQDTDEAGRRARVTEITAYLDANSQESRPSASLLRQRGQLQESLGAWEDALIDLESAIALYDTFDDYRQAALTRLERLRIIAARGDPESALTLIQREVLPVLERIGDDRSAAGAKSEVADILQERGELDEALRIRREDQLPVYERLGDVRSSAVTMVQIGDILAQRGKTAEALRLWRDQALPIFERLDDQRARELTENRIAQVLNEASTSG